MKLPLAVTCGDPAGIGPEVIAAWIRMHPAEAEGAVVIGPERWLAGLPAGVKREPVGLADYAAEPGKPTLEGSLVAWAALERAAAGCKDGEYLAAVTGPVSKSHLARIGYPFPGQTEFFASRWGGEPTMAFCGGRLRVVLATWHVPLREVPALLTPDCLKRSVAAAAQLATATGAAASPPRIGVCGLNPHAGEGGLLGTEEQEVIDPILEALAAAHPGLSRCQPADTLFTRALRGEFDVVVALYHDQGLAPLKAVEFDESVNVTLGLPHVRTSPDHGTAFAIAGKGEASFQSLRNAIRVARMLAENRLPEDPAGKSPY